MTVSTDAILFFGWLLVDDYEPPWRDDDGEGWDSIEDWHRGVTGYKPPFILYTKEGEYISGIEPSEKMVEAYYAAEAAWDEKYPVPVEEVRHCSGAETMYAIAVPGTIVTARRGYPEKIDPRKLTADPDAIEAARRFCRRHEVRVKGRPKWWLASWWDGG